jgi:predicted XRE-type DNA-binding protein
MNEKLVVTRGSDNVFRDLGFGTGEAENLRLRSQLMMRIDALHRESGMTLERHARRLGLTPPRLNALLKGRLSQFTLDALVEVAIRGGLSVRLNVT